MMLAAWGGLGLAMPVQAQSAGTPRVLEPVWGARAECPAMIERLQRGFTERSAEAYLQAARLYELGECLPRSEPKAAEFLDQAARLGSALAARQLAVRFARGRGVPQSYLLAGAWLAGKGVSEEQLGPWDYSIGYAHAVASAVLDSVLWPVAAFGPKAEVWLVVEVNALNPRAVSLRLTGERTAAQETLRAQLAAAFDVAATRALGWLAPADPQWLVPAWVAVPLVVRMTEDRRVDLRDDEPVLR
jgi:hypothetical protein